MQRRTNSSRSKNGTSSNGGSYSETKKRYKTQQVNNHSQRHYQSSSSMIPKPLIGTLFVFGIGAIFILVSKLVSSPGSGAGTNGSNHRNIRSVTKNNIDQPLSSSISTTTAGGGSTPLKIVNGDNIGLTSPVTNATLHIIFSTDCGTFQHWQSYLFFHAALKVKQPGYITRIASGCTDTELQSEKQWHKIHIQNQMSDRFRIHFTPHFSGVKDEKTGKVKGDYKFFNKPFGLKHYLEENDLLGVVNGEMKHPNDIIILTDPDFLLLRPITDDFSNTREALIGHRRTDVYKERETTNHNIVSHGYPYAQTYGLGTQWRKFDLDTIAGPNSPAKDVNQENGGKLYPAGPPYIATAKDMYAIAQTWSDFAPRVHAEYPHLLAEMYAYCIAAAHLQLPHMLIDSMMVSSAGIGGEGWKYIKDILGDEICQFATNPKHDVHPLPSVIHYCQRYSVDKYFFAKRKVPHNIFTCDHEMLIEPPMDLGSGKYLTSVAKKNDKMTADKAKMEAFVVCAMTSATNDAMMYFKTNHCNSGGNMEKTFDLWKGTK